MPGASPTFCLGRLTFQCHEAWNSPTALQKNDPVALRPGWAFEPEPVVHETKHWHEGAPTFAVRHVEYPWHTVLLARLQGPKNLLSDFLGTARPSNWLLGPLHVRYRNLADRVLQCDLTNGESSTF